MVQARRNWDILHRFLPERLHHFLDIISAFHYTIKYGINGIDSCRLKNGSRDLNIEPGLHDLVPKLRVG